jgi:two-component system NtrC family sensor kinase
MSELLPRALGETVTIETVLAGGLWKTAIDPNQLENAIINLAVNARDALPMAADSRSNRELPSRRALRRADRRRDCRRAIRHGGGERFRHRHERGCDEPRVRAVLHHQAGRRRHRARPLQVYGFARQSGGHIRIYSEVGEGTTIKLYFPRLTGQHDIPAWSARETGAPSPPDHVGGNESVLVVEDDPQVNKLAVETLEERGYRVLSAEDGPTALRMLDDGAPIDLLLTDVVLPNGMNGRQLSEEVLRRRPGIKVLFVTGYTRNAIIHHGRLDPDIDLLTKPFTADAR